MNTIRALFARIDGALIPGGCDHCDAEQHPWVDTDGTAHITIRHDHWCPTLHAIEARRRHHA